MIKYLLVDLDDTILKNSMESFAPPYFKALSNHLAPFVKPDTMLPKLLEGTRAMLENTNPELTLEMVFDGVFYSGIGLEKEKLRPHIDQFYNSVFPILKQHTSELPQARVMVMEAIKTGLKIVVATNPLFP